MQSQMESQGCEWSCKGVNGAEMVLVESKWRQWSRNGASEIAKVGDHAYHACHANASHHASKGLALFKAMVLLNGNICGIVRYQIIAKYQVKASRCSKTLQAKE
jgi:hypothetical protein